MAKIIWKLKVVLDEKNLKPGDVEREAQRLGYKFGTNSIYRCLRADGPMNMNRDTLTALIHSIHSLSGSSINIGDLLEYVPENDNPS